MRTLREPLLRAARAAREARQITALDFLRIRMASRRDDFLEDSAELIMEESLASGLGLSAGPNGIEWEKILAFIEKLIPLILKLVSLFT